MDWGVMKNWFLVFCFFLMCCGKGGNTAYTVHVYGDSISFIHKPFESYGYRVAEAMNYKINNHAISGSHIDSANQYPEMMVDEFDSGDIVLFLPGMNDSYYFGVDTTHVALYEASMKDILDRFSRLPIRVFVGTTTHTTHPNCPDSNVKLYGDIARKLIDQGNYSNIVLVDTFNEWHINSNNMLDAIHPNKVGHEEIRDIFLRYIR